MTIIGNMNKISVFGELEAQGNKINNIKLMNVKLQGGTYSKNGLVNIAYGQLIGSTFAFYNTGVLQLRDSWIDNSLNDSYDKYYIGSSNGSNTLERNVFSKSIPLVIGDATLLKNNMFYNTSEIEVDGNSSIQFEYNSIYSNTTNILKLSNYNAKLENGSNNFWNTSDKNKIDNLIYDNNDDLSLNKITYEPFLTKPHKGTPSLITLQPPIINDYSETDKLLSGYAEPNSIVKYQYSLERGGSPIAGGAVFSDANGIYNIELKNLTAGTEITLITYKNGIYSNKTKTKVKDVTPLDIPTVNEVTDKSISVAGIAEADATIIVKAEAKELGMGIAVGTGAYTVTIPMQKAGTKITVTATDKAGNVSEAREITVKDVTAPAAPSVIPVTDASTSVTGTSEADTTITVKAGAKELGTGIADGTGAYTVTISGQKAGTKITVTATDKAGNVSEAREITVKDVTAPKLIIKQLNDSSTSVTGKTEQKAALKLYINGRLQKTKARIDSKGIFTFCRGNNF
ncbi:modifier protein of major autolysin LytC [Bacillus freudenreichii]|nr:modifier protein of major autolysin LytC [Bacillus freudenreichii]